MSPLCSMLAVFLSLSGPVFESVQETDSSYLVLGTVYNYSFQALPGTHVINMNSHEGTVCNQLGIFKLNIRMGDTILFRNISYKDTLVGARHLMLRRYVRMKRAVYELQGARIFEWGSTYEDFSQAIISMPNQQTLGEELRWPRADPNLIPYDMDEEKLKSLGFLIKSPVSYLYHNYNKKAKSARKVFWNKRNRTRIEAYNDIMNADNVADLTGLSGEKLLEFMEYLSARMVCDFKCDELRIYEEIYGHWGVFQELYP